MTPPMFDNVDIGAYGRAKKLGQKAYHNALAKGENPYLPVLDELIPDHLTLPRMSLGIINIPTDSIVGTSTAGRVSAFAPNFMPILEEDSEFATKWQTLYGSVVKSGVREPVKVLEYMNRFYLVEGNKRVSVQKFLGNPLVEADVTRVIPHRTEEKENRIYFEFLDFYKDTKFNFVTFSELGCYNQLTELVGQTPGKPWPSEALIDFETCFVRFRLAFELMGVDLFKFTVADAFLFYLQIYGYHKDSFKDSAAIRNNLNRLRNEFIIRSRGESVNLVMNAETQQKQGLFHSILYTPPQVMNVAFVNNRNPDVSGWTYAHALGKNHVDSVFGERVHTRIINDTAPEECQATIERLIAEGSDIIFTTSPILLDGALKAALEHPEAKILNCSLLANYHTVRSYYLRMYEAKFIIGAIAGAVSDNNRIGYIADYPVYGIPASINAFALGAKLTNPRAKVYLEWSTIDGPDPEEMLRANDVYVICNRDISAPSRQSTDFGLYLRHDDCEPQHLAVPVWNWGSLYEDLLRRVQNGIWRNDQNVNHALNYWLGMDTGAIDVFYSDKLDPGTRRLVDLLRDQIASLQLKVFAETITSQDGTQRCGAGQSLTPADIIGMDWLCDNVVGFLPSADQLKPEAQAFVRMQGVRDANAPDASGIHWTSIGE